LDCKQDCRGSEVLRGRLDAEYCIGCNLTVRVPISDAEPFYPGRLAVVDQANRDTWNVITRHRFSDAFALGLNERLEISLSCCTPCPVGLRSRRGRVRRCRCKARSQHE
jgi:hypothetical protein